jgi:ABC-type nickel/cobalt efflux system permease component RcnA
MPGPNTGSLLQALISLIAWFSIMAAAMFLPAGTCGWMFLAAFGVFTAIACAWIWMKKRELFAARSRIQKGSTNAAAPRSPRIC